MNQCSDYFSTETPEEFWLQFSELYTNNNTTYIPSKASNTITCKCIKFPDITTHDKFEYFFSNPNSQSVDFINFEHCEFIGELDLTPFYRLKNLNFKNCKFHKNVNLSLPNMLTLTIEDSHINGAFLLENFDSSKENRKIKFKNSVFSSTVSFNNCILENTKFANVNFHQATLILSHTQFDGIKLNEVYWGEKFQANRDTFRQLKVVLENQKNFIDSQLFYSLELEEYRKELKQSSFFEKLEDKFLFSFSRIVSNFGQSWTLPLFWLITLSLALYIGLYCLGLITTCSFNDFIHFFNPLSRTAGEKFENIYGIWFLHKIFSGFLIYQFIVAAKRKTKL